MKNDEITEIVSEDQFHTLEILSKLCILEIVNWWTSGEAYYVTLKRKVQCFDWRN